MRESRSHPPSARDLSEATPTSPGPGVPRGALVLSVSLDSALAIGGLSAAVGNAIASDGTGNTYITGSFGYIVDFDPSAVHAADSDILTSHSYTQSDGTVVYTQDIFVAKYNVDGSFAWARDLSGSGGGGSGQGIAVGPDGSVYVAGSQNHAFVAKLDADGNTLWANQVGGMYDNDEGRAVAVDASGNVYLTGRIDMTATNINADTDAFVAKFDADGNLLWNEQVGGSSADEGTGIALDSRGNVLIAGDFRGTADFNPDSNRSFSLKSGGDFGEFVLKLDTNGGFVWADNFQVGRFGGSNVNGIAVDANDDVIVMGAFSGSVDFDPGKRKLNLPNAGGMDVYVVKLDAAGQLAWARSMGGADNDGYFSGGIAVDGSGGIYVTGSFMQTATFGSQTLTSAGDEDVFVAKLDASGNFVWAVRRGAGRAPIGVMGSRWTTRATSTPPASSWVRSTSTRAPGNTSSAPRIGTSSCGS